MFPHLEILSHLKPPRKHIDVLLVMFDGLVELVSLKPRIKCTVQNTLGIKFICIICKTDHQCINKILSKAVVFINHLQIKSCIGLQTLVTYAVVTFDFNVA